MLVPDCFKSFIYNKYIIGFIDIYSGWPEAFSVPAKTTDNVAHLLIEEIIRPVIFVADCFKSFIYSHMPVFIMVLFRDRWLDMRRNIQPNHWVTIYIRNVVKRVFNKDVFIVNMDINDNNYEINVIDSSALKPRSHIDKNMVVDDIPDKTDFQFQDFNMNIEPFQW
jgi:hypothetical protein